MENVISVSHFSFSIITQQEDRVTQTVQEWLCIIPAKYEDSMQVFLH